MVYLLIANEFLDFLLEKAPPQNSMINQYQYLGGSFVLFSTYSSAPTENYDKYTLSLMDAQQKELSSYREALNRMGEEIVRLQENVSKSL